MSRGLFVHNNGIYRQISDDIAELILDKDVFLEACKAWLGIDNPEAIKALMQEYRDSTGA